MTQSSARELARLRWRCRRGLRELDELLIRYLERHYQDASEPERRAFDGLMELTTPDLLDKMLGRAVPASLDEEELLDVIRSTAGG